MTVSRVGGRDVPGKIHNTTAAPSTLLCLS